MVGTWLLVPEHLRLGTWDLLCGWAGKPGCNVEPRLALQLVHEAALCVTNIRQKRCLSQKGFEVANGLPFIGSDQAIHKLLSEHTVRNAQELQISLGQIRKSLGHYQGTILAIDPHRMRSFSKRQMRRRRDKETKKAVKMAQTFFCLDADSGQPICFNTGTSSRSVTQATPELLELSKVILNPAPGQTLVLADTEHYTVELFKYVQNEIPFDLLVPMPQRTSLQKQMAMLPESAFNRRWSGFATTKQYYHFARHSKVGGYQMVQRTGERPDSYQFKSFMATSDHNELEAMCLAYPKRWHIEEFFNANQALGWNRAGTQNLNIRYGQMTMALIAQATIHQLRQRIGEPACKWEASQLGKKIFNGLDGDIRVADNTILVTFYNAPNAPLLRSHYEHLPQKLRYEGIDPHIPWLYNFMLDFRFK